MKADRGIRLCRTPAAGLGGNCHVKVLFQGLQELFLTEAVQVLHHTVIINDCEVTLRETNCHEVVVLLISRVVRILSFFLCAYACSCGGTVVTIGHIEGVYVICEDFSDTLDYCVVRNYPEGVGELVLVHKLVFRLSGCGIGHNLVEFIVVLVGKENGLDVGVLDADVDHSVVFLVLAGELMLLDYALGVVVRVGAQDKAVLGALSHGLGVHIVFLLVLTDQPAALFPGLEILNGLVIGALLVLTGNGREVNFRLCDMQEALFSGHSQCFLRVKDIVGRSRYFSDQVLGRAYCRKGFYTYHITCLLGIYGCRLRRSPQSGGRRQGRRSRLPRRSGHPSSWELQRRGIRSSW